MTNPSVYIVTVHYGQVETTKRCLDAISKIIGDPYVIVSNNDCTEDGENIKRHIKKLGKKLQCEVIQNKTNRGFAAGCNAGIKIAIKQKANYVWLLNNDTETNPNALQALYKCAQKHPHTILGSTIIDKSAPTKIQVAGGATFNRWLTTIRYKHAGYQLNERHTLPSPQIDYVHGASMFIPATIFIKSGLLNESHFLYYEELDFCTTGSTLGYKMKWCRESLVLHQGGAATKSKEGSNTPPQALSVYHNSRSILIYYRNHHKIYIPLIVALYMIVKPTVLFLRGQKNLIFPCVKGCYNGLTARFPLPLRKSDPR